jgi:predicted nucleic-acid-binding protein
MAAVDTNALVRWLTNDDAEQCAIVNRLFDEFIGKGERLYVTVTVMLELEWVLRSRYCYDKQSILSALNALLEVTELEFQSEPALEQSLWLFKQAVARDFADCLHIALVTQADKGPFLTFDDRAAKIEGAQLLQA